MRGMGWQPIETASIPPDGLHLPSGWTVKSSATVLALLLAAGPALAVDKGETITGTVERLTDGDTFRLNGVTVRLEGIDTPEARQEPREHGANAIAALAYLVQGKEISCKVTDIDRYKRRVARCALGDIDIGAALVSAGWAWNFWEYGGDLYAEEEEEAVCARRGVWAVGVVPPWHWRACRRR